MNSALLILAYSCALLVPSKFGKRSLAYGILVLQVVCLVCMLCFVFQCTGETLRMAMVDILEDEKK